MQCRTVQQQLNALTDGEGKVISGLALLHGVFCARCRNVRRTLEHQRRRTRLVPEGALPEAIRGRIMAQLPELPATPAAARRRNPMLKSVLSVGLSAMALAAALSLIRPGRAASVAEAVARVNTWHLSGWRDDGSGRVAWEVWGRRQPFLYREQIGLQVLVDDGKQRLHLLPMNAGGQQLAVRTRSLPSLDDTRWTRLTVGTDWQDAKPSQVVGDEVIYRWTNSGMGGPESTASDYFFVDRRTWLPRRWEYREEEHGSEKLVESLDVEYDVPLPDDVTTAQIPVGAQLIDALKSSGPRPTQNVQSAGGVSAQLTPLKIDRKGNVLLQARAWLGTSPLGAADSQLGYFLSLPIWARTVDGERHPWAVLDDRGRPYVHVPDLPTGRSPAALPDGSTPVWMAPLEPLAPGEPLPHTLTVNMTVLPFAMLAGGSHNLLHQDLRWTVSLPGNPAAITEDDYMAQPAQRNVRYSEQWPMSVRIADSRASTYERQSDRVACIRWYRAAISGCTPESNYAQFLRLSLANYYRDPVKRAAMLQEVIAMSQRYPQTSPHYASLARKSLGALEKKQRAGRH